MEEYSINITNNAYKNTNSIVDYIANTFSDEYLATQILINIYDEIKKLSYLGGMLEKVSIKGFEDKDIRKYRFKKYIIYYELDSINKIVNVLYVKHSLQDENKFFGV